MLTVQNYLHIISPNSEAIGPVSVSGNETGPSTDKVGISDWL